MCACLPAQEETNMDTLDRKTKKELRENVLRGCALLDKRRPRWFQQIDLDALELQNGCQCICGQLDALSRKVPTSDAWWGNFVAKLAKSRSKYGWTAEWAARHGFSNENAAYRDGAWDYMESVWRREIQARRRAARTQRNAALAA